MTALLSMNMNDNSKHIKAIDGLRALAVISIILFHIDKHWLPGGFIGVDIFFVISGFVVALSVCRLKYDHVFDYIRYFYKRRILRIYPAAFFCIVSTIIVCIIFLPNGSVSKDIYTTGFSSLFSASNFSLLFRSDPYFGTLNAFNPFVHTWSLGVEEQYYLIFPIISFALLVSANTARRKIASEIFLLILAFISFSACVYLTKFYKDFSFYMVFTRLWEFLCGFIAIYIYKRDSTIGALRALARIPMGNVASAIGAALLAIGFAFADQALFPFPWAMAAVVGTVLLSAACYQDEANWAARVLGHPAVVAIGRISYSLYLYHWVVIVLLRWTIGMDSLAAQLSAITLTLALSLLSYNFIEKPFRYAAVLKTMDDRKFYLGFFLILIATSGLLFFALINRASFAYTLTADEQRWSPYVLRPPSPGECQAKMTFTAINGGSQFDFTLRPCAGQSLNPPPSSSHIFIVGDSHAGAYRRDAARLAIETGASVSILSTNGCKPFAPVDTRIAGCDAKVDEILAKVGASMSAGDVLFLPGLYVPRYRDYWDEAVRETAPPPAGFEADDKATVERFYGVLKPLIARGLKVVFEAPKPLLRKALFRCADWYLAHNPYCAEPDPMREEIEAKRARVLGLQRRLAERAPASISVWDPLPILCPGRVCHGMINGEPLFVDADHISGYANDLLYGSLKAALVNKERPGGVRLQ
jgi:peptidoglycan/LPS O-acetylase OafA/YrhL